MPHTEKTHISVIFISYNQEKNIASGLKSILSQTYENLEIVLSDDCSTDNTFEIIQDVSAAYSGPHKIILNRNPQNLGITGNLNKAISLASGKFLVQANGDDISHPDRVSKLYEAWSKDPENIKLVYSKLDQIDMAGQFVKKMRPAKPETPTLTPREVIQKRQYIVGACTAYTLDLFEKFGPIPSQAEVEDHIIPFRASLMGRTVRVDETLVQMRQGGVSWMDRKDLEHPDNFFGGRLLSGSRRVLANYRAVSEDCSKVDFEKKTECLAFIKKRMERIEFLLETAEMPPYRLLTRLPYAYLLTVTRHSRYFLKITFRYLFKFILYPIMLANYKKKWQTSGD